MIVRLEKGETFHYRCDLWVNKSTDGVLIIDRDELGDCINQAFNSYIASCRKDLHGKENSSEK